MSVEALSKKNLVAYVGGIGSRGSVAFCQKLSKKNLQVPYILYNRPQIPILSGDGDKIVAVLSETYQSLGKIGVTHVAMLCNTGHMYLDEVMKVQHKDLKCIDMVEQVLKLIVMKFGQKARVGVIGTKGLFFNQFYEKYCKKIGIETLSFFQPLDLDFTHDAIFSVINGKDHIEVDGELVQCEQIFISQSEKLIKEMNVDVILLGCTDISSIFHHTHISNVPVIDPLDCLISATLSILGLSFGK